MQLSASSAFQRGFLFRYRKFLGYIGTIEAQFQLDFGSFRDIQRQRSLIQRMPLLTKDLGFNRWYTENLPKEISEGLPEYLGKLEDRIESLGVSPETSQYFRPMGYNTANRFVGDLPAIVYVTELRDSRFVHSTLQRVAHEIGTQIKDHLKIPIYADDGSDRFDIKRGSQDITLK